MTPEKVKRYSINEAHFGAHLHEDPDGRCIEYADHIVAVRAAVEAEREACASIPQPRALCLSKDEQVCYCAEDTWAQYQAAIRARGEG